MKKHITLLLFIMFASCKNETEITITKVSGSPEYVNAKLSLKELSKIDFIPFMSSTSQFAMSAHVLYQKIDKKNVASFSKKIISK